MEKRDPGGFVFKMILGETSYIATTTRISNYIQSCRKEYVLSMGPKFHVIQTIVTDWIDFWRFTQVNSEHLVSW